MGEEHGRLISNRRRQARGFENRPVHMMPFDGLDLILAMACIALVLALVLRRPASERNIDAERVIRDNWND